MPDSDRTAPHVHFVVRNIERSHRIEWHDCKRLVYLEEVDVRYFQTLIPKQSFYGCYRSRRIQRWVLRTYGEITYPSESPCIHKANYMFVPKQNRGCAICYL